MQSYDTAIIGAGPAGFTASLYASRYGLTNIVIGEIPGGTAFEAHRVCNFPSESEIKGSDLMAKMQKNALDTGGEFKMGKVQDVKKKEEEFELELQNGDLLKARTVILALGTKRKKLGLFNENEFLGKGISYCATCDGAFFKGFRVAVLGGSDSANTAAIYLSDIAEKVFQIYRGKELKGEKAWKDELFERENIEVILENEIKSVEGDGKLQKIKLKNEYEDSKEIDVDGLFVEIGSDPRNRIAGNLGINLDEDGYISVSSDQSTSLEGVFAAGDITDASNKFKQVITACSEGAIAVNAIFKYLSQK